MKSKVNIFESIYRRSDIDKLEAKLKRFGISRKLDTTTFLNIRFLTTIIIFVIFLFLPNGYVLAPIIAIVYFLGFNYVVIDQPLKKRSGKLEREAFYFFEVLTLSLESGRNLELAIESSCEFIDSEIASEFRETLYQIKLGKSLAEALDEMRERIPSEAINNIIMNVMQSSLFGSSIIDTLYSQIDYLREKRIMEIKAEIAKMPTKISVFSVIFFVPLILMLILAPILIDYLANL